jgi:hypothetical protein
VVAALAAARELPQLSLIDALELTLLVSRKDPRRHPRVAARWVLRHLEQDPERNSEEAALAISGSSASASSGLSSRTASANSVISSFSTGAETVA